MSITKQQHDTKPMPFVYNCPFISYHICHRGQFLSNSDLHM